MKSDRLSTACSHAFASSLSLGVQLDTAWIAHCSNWRKPMTIFVSNGFDQHPCSASAAERLVTELTNASSLWYDLRLAEMSGYDYIFAPDAVCSQLRSLSALESLLLNIQTILDTKGQRTVLIGYWHDRDQQLHFEKYRLEWAEGIAIHWHKELLDNSPQQDFIKMLYEHSEPLIAQN